MFGKCALVYARNSKVCCKHDVIGSTIVRTRAARYVKEGTSSMVRMHEIITCPCHPQCG